MKKELKQDYYDNSFLSSKKYDEHYSDSSYFKTWTYISEMLNEDSGVAEFGCGTGQFAHLLVDSGIRYSYGTDFSDVAIEKAKLLVNRAFFKADLYDDTTYIYGNYNTAIFLEVLEHLEQDLLVLSYLPKGTRVIITVPNFDSVSHVRYFDSLKDVKARYRKAIKISGGKTFKIGKKEIYLIHGTV